MGLTLDPRAETDVIEDPKLPVVLIGPMAAGKSTTARALARRLGVRLVPLDAIRWYYHLADGFDFSRESRPGGFGEVVREWEPYSIAAMERVVAEFPDAVIDTGAGHAHYEDPARVRRLGELLAPLPNVLLILPCADLDRAEAVCNERDRQRLGPAWDASRDEVNARFLRSEVFRRVAKHTVCVEDRSVDEVVDDIVRRLR